MSAPDTREDAKLVKLVLAGDTELYAVLVNRYRTRVSRYVERFTYDVEDARDVTQDVFIKVYGALDSFDPRFKFSTWLFRIAGNAAIDHLRRRRVRLLPLEHPPGEDGEARAVDPPETRPNPHEELTRRRLREALSAAIDRLPDD
ncbi:MAG: RNA polymerase sigma factor, partial [Thermoanaerobaculia bacterium]